MSAGRPILEARGIVKRYGELVAVDRADFSLAAGEVVGLVGKNGAGKSTLLRILAGAAKPDEGEIRVDGEPVEYRDPRDAARHGFAFVYQELADAPQLSVTENVLLGTGLDRRLGVLVDWKASRDHARRVLAELDDSIDPRAKLASLSVAKQRIVMIARALAAEAKAVVLDEPTAALTQTEIDHLHAVVRSLSARGVAIVYVSHRLSEIFQLTSRTVVMRDGRVVADIPTADIDTEGLIGHISGTQRQRAKARRPVEREPGAELLRAENLSRDGAVDDVDLVVREGEVVGIAGLVGAGRTELVRLLVGADRRDAGTIRMRGQEVRMRSPAEAARTGVVLLPEDRRSQGTVMTMNVRENVTLPSLSSHRRYSWLGVPSRRRERDTAEREVGRLAIKVQSAEDPVRWLSGGNQQKVVLGKWLARGADVLIFDEPTSGIDIDGKAETYTHIRDLAGRGKGVLFVSSDFAEFDEICDRVLVMREGRLVGELAAADISESRLVAACYA